MNKTKSVRFQETIDVYICPSDDTIDTEDDGDLSELALDLAESAITAAIKTVEGSNPVWVPKGLSHYIMSRYQATNKITPCLQKMNTPSKISTGSHTVNSQQKGAVNKLRSLFW